MTAYAMWSGAAVAAGLAVWLWLPAPPRRPDRRTDGSRSGSSDPYAASVPSGWRGVLAGRSDAGITPRRRWWLGVGAGLALGGAAHTALGWWSLLIGAVTAVILIVGLGWLEPAASRRRRWLVVVQVPQVLELLAAGLSAGLPLRTATAGVVAACPGPVADDLAVVLQRIELGMADVEAWRVLRDHPQLGPVAVDLSRSVESGTRLVATLSTHAADARIARRAAIEIEARKVGVRSVLPLMICFIPAFLLLGVVPTVASALMRAFAGLD